MGEGGGGEGAGPGSARRSEAGGGEAGPGLAHTNSGWGGGRSPQPRRPPYPRPGEVCLLRARQGGAAAGDHRGSPGSAAARAAAERGEGRVARTACPHPRWRRDLPGSAPRDAGAPPRWWWWWWWRPFPPLPAEGRCGP